jgi:hypothetical protein
MNDSPQTRQSVLQNRQQQGNQMLLTSPPLVHYGQIYEKLLVNLLKGKCHPTVNNYRMPPKAEHKNI